MLGREMEQVDGYDTHTELIMHVFITIHTLIQVLDNPVKTLLQVSSKSNAFYREDAEKALREMVRSVSHCRSLPALINGGASNASAIVHKNVSMLICETVEYWTPTRFLRSPHDILEKTMTAVAQLLSDADPGARYFARKTLYQFLSESEFEQRTIRLLSISHQMKVRDMMDTLRRKVRHQNRITVHVVCLLWFVTP